MSFGVCVAPALLSECMKIDEGISRGLRGAVRGVRRLPGPWPRVASQNCCESVACASVVRADVKLKRNTEANTIFNRNVSGGARPDQHVAC